MKNMVDEYKSHYGFEVFDCSCMKTPSIKLTRKIFREFKMPFIHSAIAPIQLNELKLQTESQLLSYFANLDLNINYLDQIEIDRKSSQIFRTSLNEQEKLLELVTKKLQVINLFDLPIVFGQSQVHTIDYPEMSLSILKQIPVCFDYVALNHKINVQSIVEYIHECLHVLTLRNKGSIKNYYHNEVLSIFMELVTAKELDEDIFKIVEAKRFFELRIDCQFLRETPFIDRNGIGNRNIDMNSNLYIIGLLLAETLLDLYLKGNQQILLKDIETILNGGGSLEDLLDDYQINFNNNSVPDAIENAIQKRINRF